MMKRILYIIPALALLAAGCAKEMDFVVPEGEQDTITLDLRPLEIQTRDGKDGVKDGVASYNENTINDAHLFFYASNAADDAPAVKSLYIGSVPATRKVSLPTSAAEIRALFGGTNEGRKCNVYVVANYDGSTAINHDRSPKYSRNELKALVLAAATWNEICDEDGAFTPSDTPAFVMTGEAELTSRGATSSPVVDGAVEMARVASKVTFSLTVADEIEVDIFAVDERGNRIKVIDPGTNEWTGEYQKRTVTMKPSKQAMSVNLCFANDFAELSGDSYSPSGKTDEHLFDYPYRSFEESDGVFNAQPFYSYPQKWEAGAANQPYLKLLIPWTPYEEGGAAGNTKNYYYKVPIPEGELKKNNWYQIGLDVSILGGEEQEPIPVEIKYCVAPWVAGSESDATVVTARYLSVPRKSFTLYNTEDLKVPMLSSHPCEIVNVTVTKPRYGTSTYSNTTVNFTNASTVDDQLVLNSLDEIDLIHTINNEMGTTMDCAPYTITFRVRQIDEPDYYADITVLQYPAIYIEKSTGGNAFVDGYYTLVTGGRPETGNGGGSRNVGGTTYYYHGGSFNPNGDGTRITPYGNLNGGTANSATIPTAETENTRIHVTAFTSTSNTYTYNGQSKPYIIGDPRIPFMEADQITDKTLTNYLTPGGNNNGTTAWTQAQLNALMVGTSVDNIIAPAFMFASEFGRQGTGASSFQTVAKRCATYQEKGYPAGRWRLPTEAEVAFCAYLQANNFIGRLFDQGQYWISNGTAVSVNGANVTSQASGNSTRCVYDLWYWGEEPATTPDYRYAVMP